MEENPLIRGTASRTASRKKQDRLSGVDAPATPVTCSVDNSAQFADIDDESDDIYERLPCDTASTCSEQSWQYANPQEQNQPTVAVQRSVSAVKHRPPVPLPTNPTLPSHGKYVSYEQLIHEVGNFAPETDSGTSFYEPINTAELSDTTNPTQSSTVNNAIESRDTRPDDVISSGSIRESDAAAAVYCDVSSLKKTTNAVDADKLWRKAATAATTRQFQNDRNDYQFYEYFHGRQPRQVDDLWAVDSSYDDLGDLGSTFHFRQSSRHLNGGTCSTFSRMGSFAQLKRNVLRQSNYYTGVERSPPIVHPSQLYEALKELKKNPRDTAKQANINVVVLVRLMLGGCHALVDVMVLVGSDVNKMNAEKLNYRSQGYALGTSTECQLTNSEGEELLQVELKVTDWMPDATLIGRSTFDLPVEALQKGGIQPCAFGIKSRDAVKSRASFNSIFVCEITGRQSDLTVMTVGLNCDLHKCKTPGRQHVFRNCTCDDCDNKTQQQQQQQQQQQTTTKSKSLDKSNNNNNNNNNNRRHIPSHAHSRSAPVSQPQRLHESVYFSADSKLADGADNNVHGSVTNSLSLRSDGPGTAFARRTAARNSGVDAPVEMENRDDAGPPCKAWFDTVYRRDGRPIYYV